jgi:maltooligosyltrehalose trehalohydrolase
VPFAALKLAAGLVLCVPNIPLLFMGEEYGETAPFLYFTSHTDPTLARAVREGRRQEFARFAWSQEVPDPQDPQTFSRSILHHQLREQDPQRALLRFYRDVIALRKSSPALRNCSKEHVEAITLPEQKVLLLRRWQPHDEEFLLLVSFAAESVSVVPPLPPGRWQLVLTSGAEQYGGHGQAGLPAVLHADEQRSVMCEPFTFALYRRDAEVE